MESLSSFFSQVLSTIGTRVLHHGHKHHHHSGGNLWTIPSTVDWCEPNYQVTSYIAEFFNTSSSLAMVLCGVLGIILHYRDFETRFILSFASVAIVGVGSVLFHATLLFSLQMADELPMIYSSLVMTFIMSEHLKLKSNPYLPFLLTLHGIVSTAFVASPVVAPKYASPLLQFISFHLSFLALETYLLRKSYLRYKESKDEATRTIYSLGARLWVLAIGCWITDYVGCDYLFEGDDSIRVKYFTFTFLNGQQYTLPNPQLHSWWHICASSGLYLMSLFVAADRQAILGKKVKIEYFWHLVPYARTVTPPNAGKVDDKKATEAAIGKSATIIDKKIAQSKKLKFI